MHLALSCHITIGKLATRFVTDVQIQSTWKELTDTCTITFPRNIRLKAARIEDLIKVGDAVQVELGYNGELRTEFQGYVRRILPQVPIQIECEDAMWLLKEGSVSVSERSIKLDELVRTIVPSGLEFTAVDSTLGQVVIREQPPAKILQAINKQYGFPAYFLGGRLYVGSVSALRRTGSIEASSHTLRLRYNTVADNLTFKKKDDLKIKVIAENQLPDDTVVKTEFGDADGRATRLYFYNRPASEVKAEAEEYFNRLKQDGMDGSVTTIGTKFIQHGDIVELLDDEYPDRQGSYFVEKVVVSFGQGGYRRELTLGARAA